jgi:hypothetical protein
MTLRKILSPPWASAKRGTGKLPCGHSRIHELSNGACVRCVIRKVMQQQAAEAKDA